MQVFRIEDEEGKGPYQTSKGLWGLNSYQSDWRLHPTYDCDEVLVKSIIDSTNFINPIYGRLHFGFSNIDQLRKWFYSIEWLEYLHNNGYAINIYEAQESYHGDTQAVFDLKTAKWIESISLFDLVNT